MSKSGTEECCEEDVTLETEIKLTYHAGEAAEAAPKLFEKLRGLDGLAGFTLGPAVELHNADIYVDTPQGHLHAQKATLRLREVGGRRLLTLKSKASRIGDTFQREELELPFTAEALAQINSQLHDGDLLPPEITVTLDSFAVPRSFFDSDIGTNAPPVRSRMPCRIAWRAAALLPTASTSTSK